MLKLHEDTIYRVGLYILRKDAELSLKTDKVFSTYMEPFLKMELKKNILVHRINSIYVAEIVTEKHIPYVFQNIKYYCGEHMKCYGTVQGELDSPYLVCMKEEENFSCDRWQTILNRKPRFAERTYSEVSEGEILTYFSENKDKYLLTSNLEKIMEEGNRNYTIANEKRQKQKALILSASPCVRRSLLS